MDGQVSRQWLRPWLLSSVALLAAAFMILGSAAKAQAQWHWWGALKAECRSIEPNGHSLNYAIVSATMVVANEGPGNHWASAMRIKARLVPDKSHENYFESWTRSWRTFSVAPLFQEHTYHQRMKVATDTVSPAADWKVQYKLTWDRSFPFPDVGSTGELPFHTCESSSGIVVP